MSRRIVFLRLLCLMKSFVISHLFSSYLVHRKLKNISNISKSTSWFRGWKLTIELTYSRIVNKQLQCVTKFVKALLQGRSACSHFSFIFVSCLSFLFSAFMVSRVSFVSHLSWNSLKVVKIVQTFNIKIFLEVERKRSGVKNLQFSLSRWTEVQTKLGLGRTLLF